MKNFTKQAVKNAYELANDCGPALLEDVTEFILDEWDEYDDPKQIVIDLLEHGCQSGMVGYLVYYSQTTAYYEEHREEINKLLYDAMDECGIYDPSELFGDKWDKEDPLAINSLNQNLLAWFGFEATMRRFARQFKEFEDLV